MLADVIIIVSVLALFGCKTRLIRIGRDRLKANVSCQDPALRISPALPGGVVGHSRNAVGVKIIDQGVIE